MGRAFKEQVYWLSKAWEGWSEAEQIVALYSVARKLSPITARFLQNLLSYNLSNDGSDISAIEMRANDPAWVSQIACECMMGGVVGPDGGASWADLLLAHLPLLRPNNAEAKANYLALIPKAVSAWLCSGGVGGAERARQLLSFALVHPAFSAEERRALAPWIALMHRSVQHSAEATTLVKCDSAECCCGDDGERRDLCPLHAPPKQWNSLQVDGGVNVLSMSRRSSESESANEEGSAPLDGHHHHPGMRDISLWLKWLRLHKYRSLVCCLRYDELLSLTETSLEARGVTKGAGHKFVINIAKLKDRDAQLASIEKDLMNGGSVTAALSQLKPIAFSPMIPSPPSPTELSAGDVIERANIAIDERANIAIDEPDLPALFTRVLGKVCSHLLMRTHPDQDCVTTFVTLADVCSGREAFSAAQLRRIGSWRQQVARLRAWRAPKHNNNSKHYTQKWRDPWAVRGGTSPPTRYVTPAMAGLFAQAQAAAQFGYAPQPHFYTTTAAANYIGQRCVPSPITTATSTATVANRSSLLLSPQHFLTRRPSLQETPVKQSRGYVNLHRTRSAPSRPHQLPLQTPARSSHLVLPGSLSPSSWVGQTAPTGSPAPPVEPSIEGHELDLTNQLESLCLSMTEHALG